jgi:hypothetical protein
VKSGYFQQTAAGGSDVELAIRKIGLPTGCALQSFRGKVVGEMGDEITILEVSLFGGRILVTFSDGMLAFLKPGQIRHLAVEAHALMPLPIEQLLR